MIRHHLTAAVVSCSAFGCADTNSTELDCDIALNEIATIRASGPSGPSAESSVRLIGDRFFVAPTFNPGEISVFDATGTHVHSFGQFGSGPGENREIEAIEVWADTLLVHDPAASRISKYLPSGEYAGIAAVLHSYSPFTVLRNGDLAMIPNSQSDDPAILEIRRADEAIATFTIPNTASAGFKVNAILADADSGNVWLAIRFVDMLERYSPSGQVLSRITMGEKWLQKDRSMDRGQPLPDSVAGISGVAVDSSGNLFTLVTVYARLPMPATGGEHQEVRPTELRDRKAVVRVFESGTGRMIAQLVQPKSYLRGFVDARHAYAESELPDGTPVLKVYRMELRDSPGGAACSGTAH